MGENTVLKGYFQDGLGQFGWLVGQVQPKCSGFGEIPRWLASWKGQLVPWLVGWLVLAALGAAKTENFRPFGWLVRWGGRGG